MKSFLDRAEGLFRYAALGAITLIMCLVATDAANRYLLGQSILGVYEFTERYLMVIAVFLATCCVYRGGALIRVTFFLDRVPRRLRLALEYFNHIFSILIVVFFIAATIKKAHRMFVSGATMDFRDIPLWPAYAIVPIGLLFLAIIMIIDIPRITKGETGLLKRENQE